MATSRRSELTNAKVSWPLLKEGVHHLLGFDLLGHEGSGGYLLLSLLWLRLQTQSYMLPVGSHGADEKIQ